MLIFPRKQGATLTVPAKKATFVILVAVLVGGVLFAGCQSKQPAPAGPTIQVGPSSPPVVSAGSAAWPSSPHAGRAVGPFDQPTPPQPQTWLSRVQPMAPIYDPVAGQMNLAACGRDTAGFSFEVVAPAGGLGSVRVTMTDLELVEPRGPAKIGRQTIELFRVLPVRVTGLPAWYQLYEDSAVNRRNGEFPDAAVPVDHHRLGQPWRLLAGEKLVLWVDVPVPADTAPGLYEGRLAIISETGPAAGFAIRLRVLPLNLPEEPALVFYCPLDVKQMLASDGAEPGELSDAFVMGAGRADATTRLARWVELGRRHGVQFLPADLAPVFKRTLDGQMQVDWEGYDAIVGPVLAGPGAPRISLAPFRLDYPAPELYGGLKSDAYRQVAEQYLAALGEHWSAKQWPKAVVWIHREEPVPATLPYGSPHWRDWLTERRREESITVGDLVWRAEWGFGYFEPMPWALRGGESPRAEPARQFVPERLVPPHVTVYCPPAEFIDPASLGNLRRQGLSPWLGTGGPPWRPGTNIFAAPEQIEAFAYLSHMQGIESVLLNMHHRWPSQSPLAAPVPAAEAGFLFYAGRWFDQDRPVASVRLKHLRQAVQTAAKMKLLGDLHRRAPADAIAAAMVKHAMSESAGSMPGVGGPVGWQQEPAFYIDARMMIDIELLRATGRAEESPSAEARYRLLWLQFHERTAWLHLLAGPGQLVDELTSFGSPSGKLRAVFRLWPFCERAVCAPSVPGAAAERVTWPVLDFLALPGTWAPTRHRVPVEAQPAGPASPLAMAMDGQDLAIDKTGRMAVPLVVRGEAGQELASLLVSVPVLPAHQFRQPPTVDGQLDDWPTASWYRGGGFARLTAGGPVGMFAPQPSPPLESYFQAGYDEHHLYLAIVCQGQKPDEIVARYANNVRMDRGLVVDEDVVRVVLDPTGGRRRREDLLHLLIKPTGTVLGWRGITGADGTGPPPAWGRNVRAEVRFQPTYWTIELAISRDELGETNAAGLWRINIVRHVASTGEHSAWASGNPMVNEPETLGNLLLRPPPLPKREIPLIPPSPLH